MRQNPDLRISSTSIPTAAVAGAQFTKGNQLQVKFILQLSCLFTQIYNTENTFCISINRQVIKEII